MSETKNKDDTMTDEKAEKDDKPKKTLSLGGTLSLKGGAKAPAAPRSPGISVEVRRSRRAPSSGAPSESTPAQDTQSDENLSELHNLTSEERQARAKALQDAIADNDRRKKEREEKRQAMQLSVQAAKEQEKKDREEEEERQKQLEELRKIDEQELKAKEKGAAVPGEPVHDAPPAYDRGKDKEPESYRDKLKRSAPKAPPTSTDRRRGKLTVSQAINRDYDRDRGQSLAAQKRAREKARLAAAGELEPAKKVLREVILPETITVQELANRMTERSGDVVKALMKMGVMATINQTIDADTAELVVDEFGHKVKRVTDADVEEGIQGIEDDPKDLKPRPPVVTIMGHVDHGKTSLLDALRSTNVVSGEAGGITQHIGAYQIMSSSGQKITFLDTPGHAAFTEMRARGANVTDIVILVVAANDSIMPQTIEAIAHAKAAGVPVIVAINKIDLHDADPMKVKTDLLQYEIVVEDLSGDVQCVEISAKQRLNLDKLEEAILLQSEILELKANPDRDATGVIVESKMEQGRGSVATALIQNGTLKIGDVFVAGAQYGKVRAIINDQGKNIDHAIPGQPVEVLGLNGTPDSGDQLVVVEDESKARSVAGYRQRKKKANEAAIAVSGRTTIDDLLQRNIEGEKTTLPIVIKGDVHGSVEAIIGSLNKMVEENEGIAVQFLHTGVGGITESDVILAAASKAMIIGFNVRANAQARDMAQRDGVNIQYYNVIYNVIDDAKAMLSGMLSPTIREEYLGQAKILQVFNITKVGKVAGCDVAEGMVKRGSKVRLLRDDVVIHEGMLKTLKRFQDEVKEVKQGMECGMAFENYDDIKADDIIECYDIIEEERTVT